MKKNILHIIPTLSKNKGGGDRACFELARAQAHMGLNIKILTFDFENSFISKSKNLNIFFLKQSNFRIFSFLAWSFRLEKSLNKLISESDIIHIHSMWRLLDFHAFLICKKLKKPFIFQPHGSLEPWRLKYKWFFKKLWYEVFEKQKIKNSSFIIAESKKDSIHIKNKIKDANIKIFPCGTDFINTYKSIADFNEIFPNIKIDNNFSYILYIGRIDVHKGLDILIKSIHKKIEELNSFKFLFVGPDYDDTKKELKQLINDLNISEKIIWCPPVYSDYLKYSLFKRCSFFVMPSYSENFGITALEALSTKTTSLISTETAWGDLEKLGIALNSKPELNEFSSSLIRLINLPSNKKNEMREKGFNFVRDNFTWDSVAKFLQDDINKI